MIDLTGANHAPTGHLLPDFSSGVLEEVTVANAANDRIDGHYHRDGECDGVSKFVKRQLYDGKQYMIFRSELPDGSRAWNISLVNAYSDPGHTDDVNCYSSRQALFQSTDPNVPPPNNWHLTPTTGRGFGVGVGVTVYPSVIDLEAPPLMIGGYPVVTHSQFVDDICGVCHNGFLDGELRLSLSCGHCLHRLCFNDLWMRRHDSCPICRRAL